jgi:cytochrome c-type biogenesis protein CcmH
LILAFLLALLAFGALLPIIAPLLRGGRPVASRGSFDQAVYRDQLRELDRDIARGLITGEDADAARLEIQRRLLATDKLPTAPSRLSRSPLLAMVVFAVIGAGSVGSYLWLGAPEVPDVPFSGRKAVATVDSQANSLDKATEALSAKLKQNPSDRASWVQYGRNLAMLNQFDKAEDAYRHAMALGQNDPDVMADHAEVLVLQAGGTVTPAAEAALKQVLALDPSNGLARYYLSIAAMQAGEPKQAIDGFQALLAEQPSDSPLRAQLALKIAEAAHSAGIPVPELAKGTPPAQTPGPDANAVANAANMPDAEREAMIRGMVAQLAAKQDADPANLDGWLRLGQAYAVLHEPDKAADAYEKAAKLKPDDISIPLQEVRALLTDQPPTEKLPGRVVALLKRVEASDPDQPLVLWYLGMAAVQDGHADEGRRYWGKLLTKIPQGTEDARMIQSAMDALPKQ